MRDCPVGTGYAGKYCVPDGTRGDAYANDFSTNILSLPGYNLNEHFLDHVAFFIPHPSGFLTEYGCKNSKLLEVFYFSSLTFSSIPFYPPVANRSFPSSPRYKRYCCASGNYAREYDRGTTSGRQ